MRAAIDVRHRRDVDVRGLAAAARTIELVGADLDQGIGVAVIRYVDHHNLVAAGMGPRQA